MFCLFRYESFLLAPDEKKVEEKIDTRMPNTSYFHFNKEDHTLANLLRAKLLSSNHILFAAYRVNRPRHGGTYNLTSDRCRTHCSLLLSFESKQMAKSLQRRQSLLVVEILLLSLRLWIVSSSANMSYERWLGKIKMESKISLESLFSTVSRR